MPSSNMPVTIYQVELSMFGDDTYEEVIAKVIKRANATGFNFKPDKVQKTYTTATHPVHVYYSVRDKPPAWTGFLGKVLAKDSALLSSVNWTYSFLSFIEYDENLYVICGGQGNFAIQPYVGQEFGMEMLTRLIKADSKVIRQIQDRGVTGIVLGQTRFYRGDQTFKDQDQFGKIFKQVAAELDQDIMSKKLGFNKKNLKRKFANCLAKNSFQIRKSIGFDDLLSLLGKFNKVLKSPQNFSLNKVNIVSRRGPENKLLLEELREHLIKGMFDTCRNGDIPDVDVCHRNFEDYLRSGSFFLKSGTEVLLEEDEPFSFQQILRELKKQQPAMLTDYYLFKNCLTNYEIVTENEGEIGGTSGDILEHLHGELTYKGNVYFFIDGEWYRIDPHFISDLNVECTALLNDAWDEDMLKPKLKIGKRERDFNEQYVGRPSTLVFDTVVPQKIEACDILEFNDEEVWLFHVKKGFDNSMRDLTAQINIAAKRIREDRKSGFGYIRKLEQLTKGGLKSKSPFRQKLARQTFPAKGLQSVFEGKKERNIIFCLAVADTASTKRSIKDDMAKFNSNIAKYALIELKRELTLMGFGFRVIQLEK